MGNLVLRSLPAIRGAQRGGGDGLCVAVRLTVAALERHLEQGPTAPPRTQTVGAPDAVARRSEPRIGRQHPLTDGRAQPIAKLRLEPGLRIERVVCGEARGRARRPQLLHTARRRTPHRRDRQRHAPARDAGVEPERARRAPLLVGAVRMRQETAHPAFHRQALCRIGVLQPEAGLHARSCFRIAPVMAQPDLQRRGDRRSRPRRKRPRALHRDPHAAHIAARRLELASCARPRRSRLGAHP